MFALRHFRTTEISKIFLFQLIVETSAAISVAALFTEQFKKLDPSIKKVGVVLCGGNVDIDNLPW